MEIKLAEEFAAKAADGFSRPPLKLAFLGDSVTQGCFESEGVLGVSHGCDFEQVYHAQLKRLLGAPSSMRASAATTAPAVPPAWNAMSSAPART